MKAVGKLITQDFCFLLAGTRRALPVLLSCANPSQQGLLFCRDNFADVHYYIKHKRECGHYPMLWLPFLDGLELKGMQAT